MKAIARLGLGWLLMFTGAAALWQSGTAVHPRSRTLTAVEALGRFRADGGRSLVAPHGHAPRQSALEPPDFNLIHDELVEEKT